MSTDNSPSTEAPEPMGFAELHIGAGVLVFAERAYLGDGQYSGTHLDLVHEGYQDDLLRAKIITSLMLTPPGKGKHYSDPNGRSVRIARRWCERDGQPYRYLKVTRAMNVDELSRWPSGPEALAAYDRHRSCQAAEHQRLTGQVPTWAPKASPLPPPRPALRLAVDNTRGPDSAP